MSDGVELCRGGIADFVAATNKYGGMGYTLYWALEEPYPLAIESNLGSIWPTYERLTDEDRESIREAFNGKEMRRLLTYAARMATQAVREHDSRHLRRALLALSLGRVSLFDRNLRDPGYINDDREVQTIRVLLIDAARRLGAISLFAEIEPLASESMRPFLRNADTESRTARSMGFMVTEDEADGFRYRWL